MQQNVERDMAEQHLAAEHRMSVIQGVKALTHSAW